MELHSSQSGYNPTKVLIFSSRAQCLEQLVSICISKGEVKIPTFCPNIPTSSKRKNQKEANEQKCLEIIRRDTFSGKIMVLTSCPCAVPNPVRRTTPRHPPSGVWIGEGISKEGVACRILVPLNNTVFLCTLSASRASLRSQSWMDSFSRGVDSPESMASLTMTVPLTRRTSAGTLVSAWERTNLRVQYYEHTANHIRHTDRHHISRQQLVRLNLNPF